MLRIGMMVFLLIFTVCQSSLSHQDASSLQQYQWKNRLIIINTNSEEAIEQIKLFQKSNVDFQERDLVLIQLKDNDVYVNSKQTALDAITIRKNLAIGRGFECLLVGKDGSVKSRSREIKDAAYFFGLIDQMPMRQSEMKKPG